MEHNHDRYEDVTAYIRAYSYPTKIKRSERASDIGEGKQKGGKSELVDLPAYSYECLTFDTETVLTPGKTLLYGWYIVTGYSLDESFSRALAEQDGLKPEWRDVLKEVGIFYGNELTEEEIETIKHYCTGRTVGEIGRELGVEVQSRYAAPRIMHVSQFVEMMYQRAFMKELLVVGLNLPFDLSRLLPNPGSWYEPEGKNKGSFMLKLSPTRPGVRIYHVGYAKNLYSLERYTHLNREGKRVTGRAYDNMHFLDLQQASGALLGPGSHSLENLGKTLNILKRLRKKDRPETDYRPQKETLDYALQDVLATYACYMKLRSLYAKHDLSSVTKLWNLVSGASLGKAYLKKIGLRSFKEQHPDFPVDVTGYAMNAFMGGRSEIAVRLKPVRGRLRDFSGQYPLVCSLLGMQKYWLAGHIGVDRQAQEKAQSLLDKTVDELLAFLHDKQNWKELLMLCKVKLEGGLDRFPVRAEYGKLEEDDQEQKTSSTNIAIPYVRSDYPLWYTIQDCIASKLLTGNTPEIVEAIEFVASNEQYPVKPVQVMGESTAKIDLSKEEFFTRIGDLRQEYKALVKQAEKDGREEEKAYYDSVQTALKLLQNSTSYGSLVEILLSEPMDQEQEIFFHTIDGEQKAALVERTETPGKFFSPLGPFITASGRLLLAIAERLGVNAGFGLDPGESRPPHAFCDTDSMFYVCPPGFSWEDFVRWDEEIGAWFQALSPYAGNTDVFKLEIPDAYCFAVSAKRYVLYTVREETRERQVQASNGRRMVTTTEHYTVRSPTIVKLSSHGLGAIQAPYNDTDSPFSDVPEPVGEAKKYRRWIYDLWYRAVYEIENEAREREYELQRSLVTKAHKGFSQTAMHQITISSPHVMNAYEKIGKISPFSFFTLLPPISKERVTFSFAAMGKNASTSEKDFYEEVASKQTPFYTMPHNMGELGEIYRCDNNERVPDFFQPSTISEQLSGYFEHQELKANNPKGVGVMGIRMVHIVRIRYMGKEVSERLEEIAEESNGYVDQWREQIFTSTEERESEVDRTRRLLRRLPLADVLFVSDVNRRTLLNFLHGEVSPNIKTLNAVKRAVSVLESGSYDDSWHTAWPPDFLAKVIKCSEEQARNIRSGQVSFTMQEKRRILAQLKQRSKSS